jgi:hypothetical protein
MFVLKRKKEKSIMKAQKAMTGLDSREFIILWNTAEGSTQTFFGPSSSLRSNWVTDLGKANLYKTWKHAERAIKRNGLTNCKYTSLKEYQSELSSQ